LNYSHFLLTLILNILLILPILLFQHYSQFNFLIKFIAANLNFNLKLEFLIIILLLAIIKLNYSFRDEIKLFNLNYLFLIFDLIKIHFKADYFYFRQLL
jgi:hypothetical protein